jgi:hypothetical protein
MKTLVVLEADSICERMPHNRDALYALEDPDALLTAVDRMLSESNSMQPQA